MKLTISVITMNRSRQLKEALDSCIKCQLPMNTEFVVIDNASTDDTELVVKELMSSGKYSYYYEKLPENLGVGGGRNYAFEKSNGDLVYVLDDDAVIDFESDPNFFLRAINVFENNPSVVTLTTQIYDTAWGRNRVEINGKKLFENIYAHYMFCGGSHFLRKSFFENAPYIQNRYGFEEMLPSLRVFDQGKMSVFCSDLRIIHKPEVNKWNYDDPKCQELFLSGFAIPYAIKQMMYPAITQPILYAAYVARKKKYVSKIENANRRMKKMKKDFQISYPIDEKIKLSTVVRMYKYFGVSIF